MSDSDLIDEALNADTLLACPFCASVSSLEMEYESNSGTWQVLCENCAALGPYGETPEEALDKWQTRDE